MISVLYKLTIDTDIDIESIRYKLLYAMFSRCAFVFSDFVSCNRLREILVRMHKNACFL